MGVPRTVVHGHLLPRSSVEYSWETNLLTAIVNIFEKVISIAKNLLNSEYAHEFVTIDSSWVINLSFSLSNYK